MLQYLKRLNFYLIFSNITFFLLIIIKTKNKIINYWFRDTKITGKKNLLKKSLGSLDKENFVGVFFFFLFCFSFKSASIPDRLFYCLETAMYLLQINCYFYSVLKSVMVNYK